MLDIRFVRENPKTVEEDLKKRGDFEKIAWVDELLRLDVSWRRVLTGANELREKRNTITRQIEALHRKGLDTSDMIGEAASIPAAIASLEEEAARYH